MKRLIAILLSVLLLSACAAGGQAPAPVSSTLPESPSSAAEPAPAPSSEPGPETSSSEPGSELSSLSEEAASQQEKEVPPEPDQGETARENPDTSTMNPDVSFGVSAEPDFGVASYYDVSTQRAEPLREAMLNALKEIEKDYSYFSVWVADESLDVVLEIGVIHEDAVDRFLNSWTGPAWDELEKKPGRWSVAEQQAFADAAAKLDLGQGVNIRTQTAVGAPEVVSVNVWLDDIHAPLEEVERWAELPQAVKDLAQKTGAPEDLIEYMAPRYTAPGNNPDT